MSVARSMTLAGQLTQEWATQDRPDGDASMWGVNGGLVWGFGSGWSVRPTVEYNWEDSNIAALAYSSTEMWLTVR